MAQFTKAQILAKIAQRKKVAEAAKLTETRKAKALRPAVRRPQANLLEAGKRFAEKKTILSEKTLVIKEARNLQEVIGKRTESIKDPILKKTYQTLAENIYNHNKSIIEATQAGMGIQSTALTNGAGVGLVKTYFDIFFGYFPNLIAPLIASTQPIKTANAVVFYYQTVAGSTKGAVTEADVLIDPFAINTNSEFSSQSVTVAKNVALPVWGPVIPRSVEIAGQTLVWSTDTAATFGASGTVTVTVSDGNITITLAGSDPDEPTTVTYKYDNIYAPTQVPELNANIVEKQIQAKVRTLKTNFSFQAGYGFEQQFGVKLDDKLAESAMYELKREIDLEIISLAMASAPSLLTWNKNAGLALGTYEFHKLSFMDALVSASNHIFRLSKRVRGNVLVVGIDAQTIVETLPAFKGEDFGSQIGGPAVIGKIKDILVIASPDIPTNEFLMLFKDKKDDLNAGIIFAPYLPVFATQPVMLDDFVMRRAFAEAHGTLVVNANYFVRGKIINEPTAQAMFLVGADGTNYGTLDTDASLSLGYTLE